jgi:cytochrome c oxidase assembly protein subunit 11
MKAAKDQTTAKRRTVIVLLLAVVGMFGFGFALVPLYNVFCEITGLNGKTGVVDARTLDANEVDESRLVTVEFIGNTNSQLPWEVHPVVERMKVHPGQVYEASFSATNLSGLATVGQAVPSVTPSEASLYFNKTECFCFTKQAFSGGEAREMPVRFVIDSELPDNISTVTLAYTFFRVDESS